MVVPLQWHINRDKQVWGEDADEFRPQRFIDSEGKFYLPKEFMPFQVSLGCIFVIIQGVWKVSVYERHTDKSLLIIT